MGARSVSPRVKWPVNEVDHSPSFSAKLKNGGSIPPISHMSLCYDVRLVKHRDITFFCLICAIYVCVMPFSSDIEVQRVMVYVFKTSFNNHVFKRIGYPS
jgi:hypothetical protein